MSGYYWTGKRMCKEAIERGIVRSIRLLARGLPTPDARAAKTGKAIPTRRTLGKAADRGAP